METAAKIINNLMYRKGFRKKQEAAQYFGVSPQALSIWIAKGEIPPKHLLKLKTEKEAPTKPQHQADAVVPKSTKEMQAVINYLMNENHNLKHQIKELSLEIDILKGDPGIYSARWAGKNNNFNLAINKVYKELNKKDKNWFIKNKSASFVCALTIYWPNNSFVSVVEKVHGTISKYKKGKNGFGYDPIFIPKNSKLTFGQMKHSLKYKIDHRMKAFKKIKKFF